MPVAACQARAGQVQLPGDARRHGSQSLVQHPGDEAVGRMPDLRWPQAVQRPRHRTGDGHLRGTVGVEDPAVGRPRPHQRLRAGLAAEVDVAQVLERARFQALEPRRRELAVGDAMAFQELRQAIARDDSLSREHDGTGHGEHGEQVDD